jgi:hypothetical protein
MKKIKEINLYINKLYNTKKYFIGKFYLPAMFKIYDICCYNNSFLFYNFIEFDREIMFF